MSGPFKRKDRLTIYEWVEIYWVLTEGCFNLFFGVVFLNHVCGTATVASPWTTHHVFTRRSGLRNLYLTLYLMVAGNYLHVFQCAYLLRSALLKIHIRQEDDVS
jgi:hypothetical protein